MAESRTSRKYLAIKERQKWQKTVRINFVRTPGIKEEFAGIRETVIQGNRLHLHLRLGNRGPVVRVQTAPLEGAAWRRGSSSLAPWRVSSSDLAGSYRGPTQLAQCTEILPGGICSFPLPPSGYKDDCTKQCREMRWWHTGYEVTTCVKIPGRRTGAGVEKHRSTVLYTIETKSRLDILFYFVSTFLLLCLLRLHTFMCVVLIPLPFLLIYFFRYYWVPLGL